MTPIDNLAKLFGGYRALARAIGVAESAPSIWNQRNSAHRKAGHLPTEYNARLLLAGKSAGIPHAAVAKYLDKHRCPLCGAALKPGETNGRTA